MALCLASVRGCIWLREELCTPDCHCPKSSLEVSLCGKSCVDKLVEILLCEGGDVELGARTSKQISVFAFDLLTLTLSITLCLALIHIVISYLYAWLCLFVCLTCV